MEHCIYSRRLLQIMDIISCGDDYISIGDVAKKLHVSNRTIIRELKDTDYIFSQFDLTLTSKKGFGYKIIGEQEKKKEFINYIQNELKHLVANSPELRRERLLLECLQRRSIDKL
ncbi:MAG: helix-turn-helix domain-containing protein, partial [Longicatena sp.]